MATQGWIPRVTAGKCITHFPPYCTEATNGTMSYVKTF